MARASRPQTEQLPFGLHPRTLFVTGKGGVGKSTVAAAMALAYREAGVRTLLVELEGQASAAARISGRTVTYEPTAIAPSLWATRIELDKAMREYAHLRLKVRAISDRLVGNPVFEQFAHAAPGFRELMMLGRLWWLSQQTTARGHQRFQAIIVDAPATGHGLGLLGMAGVVARMFPVGPIAGEAQEIDDFIKDAERVSAVLVALPEEIPVNETIDLHGRMVEQGVDVASVVVNCMLPGRFSGEDIAVFDDIVDTGVDTRIESLFETARYEHERHAEQVRERDRLERELGTVQLLPQLYGDALEREDIASLARGMTRRSLQSMRRRTDRSAAAPGRKGS